MIFIGMIRRAKCAHVRTCKTYVHVRVLGQTFVLDFVSQSPLLMLNLYENGCHLLFFFRSGMEF